jgi:hypothetical protein
MIINIIESFPFSGKDRPMWQCMHHVPGRIRLRIPAVRGSRSLQQALRHALLAREGVDDVEIRQSSCSVIVYYQPGRLDPQDLGEILVERIAHRAGAPRDRDSWPAACRSVAPPSVPRQPAAQSSASASSLAQSDLSVSAARYFGSVIGRAVFMALLQSTVKGFEVSTQRAIVFAMTGRKSRG